MGKKMQAYKKLFNWLLLALIGLFCLIYLGYHLAYWQKIYPGIKILNQPIGNKTISETDLFLKNYLLSQNQPEFLSLFFEGQQWTLDLKEVNFSFDNNLTSQKAFQIGRSGQAWGDFQNKIKVWFQGKNLPLNYSLEAKKLEEKIDDLATQIFVPAIEPTIKVNRSQPQSLSQIIIEQGKDGQEIDKRKFLGIINQQLIWANFNPIEIPVLKVSPALTPQQMEETKKRAEKFLGKKLTLTISENSWELDENELIGFLSFNNDFEQDKIANWVKDLSGAINREPENAAFQFADGRVTEFRPARDGQVLDQKKTIDLIVQDLRKIENEEKMITLNLPIITTPPIVKTADVNDLGIKELVGVGVSFFQGSIANRIHNIQISSSRLNGLLIPPGEVFSFNQKLGEVYQLTGYKEAYIIKEGRTILGDGGGVCQASTTLFRAALNAGLPIIERRAHAYRVSYYEQNSQAGLDATVFAPTVDLKIQNDTPAHLLLQTYVDLKNQKLTYEFYGTNDDRQVIIGKSKIWDQISPPPDLYQDDPTLPEGRIKQIDWKAWGAKVAFDYKVEKNSEILQNRTFYSNYRPWQAIFLKGVGPNL